jgi:hypothetical protein
MRKAPLFIRIASCFFLFMGAVAVWTLAAAWSGTVDAASVDVSFLTNRFSYDQHPILFSVVCLFFIFSALVGLAILLRWRYAYDFAIGYALIGLGFFLTLIFLGLGLVNTPLTSILVQIAIFGGFLFYLIRNRTRWING